MSGHDGKIMSKKYKRNHSVNAIMFTPLINIKVKKVILFVAATVALVNVSYFADDTSPMQKAPPVLKKAVLCEKVLNSIKPINEGVVFSSNLGRLICFTDFDPVYEETAIYHMYYFNDKFVSRKRLELRPPRWATYSEIHLRESEKGPWRVEITDADGNILSTIRFSITD